MGNIFYALVCGVLITAALYFPGLLRLAEAVVPGVLACMAVYFLLARRTFKQVESIFNESSRFLQTPPPRFDAAIQTMEKAYAFTQAQIGVRTQVDSQIGIVYFLQKEFSKALPYLKRSTGFSHWLASAMLAVVYYKKKNHNEMRKTLEIVTKRGKKQSLAWTLRAYLLCQIGERDAAQRVLVEALKRTGNDSKVKEALLAIQNGKKLKMRSYKEQWYQFHLERPPAQYAQQSIPMRAGKAARRGRW